MLGKSRSKYDQEPKKSVDQLPAEMLKAMYTFQKEGVQFGI